MVDASDTQPQTDRSAALALLTMLCERYPATFKHDGEPPLPLAIGTPALLIVEAHVSTQEGALVGVVKGVQVVERKAPTA